MTKNSEGAQILTSPADLRGKLTLIVSEDMRYMITEEHLTLLCDSRDNNSLNWAIGFLGVSAGFLQNLFSVISMIYEKSSGFLIKDMILSAVFIACFTGFVIKFLDYYNNKKNQDEIIAKIKSGARKNLA